MLLFLVLAVNSARFQILQSYTLLLQLSVLMRLDLANSTFMCCLKGGHSLYCVVEILAENVPW